MLKFDYGKLRELMRDEGITQAELAKAIGLSERSISLKMNGMIYWRQNEIIDAAQILHIPVGEISEYFFTPKVHKREQQEAED